MQYRKLIVSILLIIVITLVVSLVWTSGYLEEKKQDDTNKFFGTWKAIEISELFAGNNITNITMTFYNDNTATITTSSKNEAVSADYYYEFDGYDTLSLAPQVTPEYSISYISKFSNYNTTLTIIFGGATVFVLEKVI